MTDHETSPNFSDPGFNYQVELQSDAAGTHQAEQAADEQMAEDLRDDYENQLENLTTIAKEVSEAAKEAGLKPVPLYQLQEKGAVRKFMNNRGKKDLVEIEKLRGWVLVSTKSDTVKRDPGKANLTNNSGLGLVLTEDGRLYGTISRKPLKAVSERFSTIPRAKIERNTFIPKEKAGLTGDGTILGEETLFPRYRPKEENGVPVILGDISDPEGGLDSPYFTPYVLEQCYDALAKFVQDNDLTAPNTPADTEDSTQETIIREPDSEPPTEALAEGGEVDPDNVIRGAFGSQSSDKTRGPERSRAPKGFSPEVTSPVDQRVATMRSQGLSNNEIYRNLVKEFHPDNVATDPMNEERIRYLNVLRHESLKKEE